MWSQTSLTCSKTRWTHLSGMNAYQALLIWWKVENHLKNCVLVILTKIYVKMRHIPNRWWKSRRQLYYYQNCRTKCQVTRSTHRQRTRWWEHFLTINKEVLVPTLSGCWTVILQQKLHIRSRKVSQSSLRQSLKTNSLMRAENDRMLTELFVSEIKIDTSEHSWRCQWSIKPLNRIFWHKVEKKEKGRHDLMWWQRA